MLPMNNCKVISEVITMADMFAPLVAQLKANPKTIVFTEGNDPASWRPQASCWLRAY